MRKFILITTVIFPLTAHAADNGKLSCTGTIDKTKAPISFVIDRDAQEVKFSSPNDKSIKGMVEARFYFHMTRVSVMQLDKKNIQEFLSLYVRRNDGTFSGMIASDSINSEGQTFHGSCVKNGFAF